MTTALLPGDALANVRVGISVSDSDDLARLGLLPDHFKLALAEITRAVLVSSGQIVYGGHLRPEGFTGFLISELQRYASTDEPEPPLLLCLCWPEHRQMSLSELRQARSDLGLYGEIRCLDVDGEVVGYNHDRGEDPAPVDPSTTPAALTSLRRYMTRRQVGRVFIGGRRRSAKGAYAGLVEEARLALAANQPIYLAGGFGGATLDIAVALGIDDGSWLPRDPAERSDGHQHILDITRNPRWRGLDNGLTDAENRILAATHRPSEIATLVSRGLARHQSQRSPGGDAPVDGDGEPA